MNGSEVTFERVLEGMRCSEALAVAVPECRYNVHQQRVSA